MPENAPKKPVFPKGQVLPINIITHLVKSHRVGGTPTRPTICCKNAKNRVRALPPRGHFVIIYLPSALLERRRVVLAILTKTAFAEPRIIYLIFVRPAIAA